MASTETPNTAPDPWRDQESLGKEIAAKAAPVNYAEMIGTGSVLLLGESHDNTPVREHIAAHAAEFKKAGITHYAIEAPHDPAFDVLNNGNTPISLAAVNMGPYSGSDGSYEHAIRAIARQGIKVLPIDIDQGAKPSTEEREAFLANNITSLLAEDPAAKIAVLIGDVHTSSAHSVPSLKDRLLDGGTNIVVARYTGGMSSIPGYLLKAASKVSMGRSEFMMNLRPYQGNANVVFGGEVDYLVHLPQKSDTQFRSVASLLGKTMLRSDLRPF